MKSRESIVHTLRVWEWRCLILLIYAIPIHEAAKNVLWALTTALVFSRIMLERRQLFIGRVEAGVLLWLAAGVLASLFAIAPDASWKGVWDMLRAAAMFWIASRAADTKESRLALIRHLVCSSALAATLGLWDCGWAALAKNAYIPKLAVQLRSVGHYNQSGAYLAMSWMLALACALGGRVFIRTSVKVLTCVLIALALLGSTSRTAMAAGLTGTILLLVQGRVPNWLRWVLLGLVLTGALALVGSPGLRSRAFAHGSLHNRVTIWEPAFDVVRSRPWSGVGLNNFRNIPLLSEDPTWLATVDHAHNLYLNALVQTGGPGLAALLILLAATGSAAWKLRRDPSSETQLLFRATTGVWLVMVVDGFSNTPLHHELSMLFFTVMGLAAVRETGQKSGVGIREAMDCRL